MNPYKHLFPSNNSFSDYASYTKLLKMNFINEFFAQHSSSMHNTVLVQINDNNEKVSFLFETYSNNSTFKTIEDRMLAVIGISTPTDNKRDNNRIRYAPKKYGYDKSHFVSHKAGGGLDENLTYLIPHLNRGWSVEGKVYRKMERYVAENENIFFFNKPIYQDNSIVPRYLEVGVLDTSFNFHYEKFSNFYI